MIFCHMYIRLKHCRVRVAIKLNNLKMKSMILCSHLPKSKITSVKSTIKYKKETKCINTENTRVLVQF